GRGGDRTGEPLHDLRRRGEQQTGRGGREAVAPAGAVPAQLPVVPQLARGGPSPEQLTTDEAGAAVAPCPTGERTRRPGGHHDGREEEPRERVGQAREAAGPLRPGARGARGPQGGAAELLGEAVT